MGFTIVIVLYKYPSHGVIAKPSLRVAFLAGPFWESNLNKVLFKGILNTHKWTDVII